MSDYKIDEAYSIPKPDMIDVVIESATLDKKFTTETDGELEIGKGYYLLHQNNWLCARYVHQGSFFMENGNSIKYELKPGNDPLILTQIILCFCLSIILIQRGQIALHGSGIILNNKAIIISGVSGAGKSTLTTALIQTGALFIADDTVAIGFENEIIVAHSAYPQRKLNFDMLDALDIDKEKCIVLPDSDKVKYAVRQSDMFYPGAVDLGAIIIIEPVDSEQVELIKIEGNNKLKYIMNNIYHKSIYLDNEFSKEQFQKCIKIAANVEVYILHRPINKITVQEQVELIKTALS